MELIYLSRHNTMVKLVSSDKDESLQYKCTGDEQYLCNIFIFFPSSSYSLLFSFSEGASLFSQNSLLGPAGVGLEREPRRGEASWRSPCPRRSQTREQLGPEQSPCWSHNLGVSRTAWISGTWTDRSKDEVFHIEIEDRSRISRKKIPQGRQIGRETDSGQEIS